MRYQPSRPRRKIIRPKECYFCKLESAPDYKDPETLLRFVSERGKIVGRMYSGICRKHQKELAQAVKRARFMAFLPFLVRPS